MSYIRQPQQTSPCHGGGNYLVAAIQDTKLNNRSKLRNTPNYTSMRKDRGINKRGGLVFVVHKDVNFILVKESAIQEQDSHLGSLTRENLAKNKISLSEIYIFHPRAAADKITPHHLTIFMMGVVSLTTSLVMSIPTMTSVTEKQILIPEIDYLPTPSLAIYMVY